MAEDEVTAPKVDPAAWQLPQDELSEHDKKFAEEHPEAAQRYPGTKGGK